MKPRPVPIVEQGRITYGPYGTTGKRKNNGMFHVKHPDSNIEFRFIVSSGLEDPPDVPRWEHVSVSIPGAERCPTWEEMCWVKDLFWGPEEAVLQLHPPRSNYVNNAEYVLHLWAPLDAEIPLPPASFVGNPKLNAEQAREIARRLFGNAM